MTRWKAGGIHLGISALIGLAVLVLPRVRDELPWLLSAGIGIVWY